MIYPAVDQELKMASRFDRRRFGALLGVSGALATLRNAGQAAESNATNGGELVRFDAPWTSPFRVDPELPFHLVNQNGQRLFILNKTAWAFFKCDDPAGFLQRARSQGVNVLRVALIGSPYRQQLKLDLWPWGGTPQAPDWSTFNEPYWDQVEQRVRLAGEHGIGIDLCLYFGNNPSDGQSHPSEDQISQQRPYWEKTLQRLGKYSNILCWEIANEYIGNEAFQDAAGTYFKQHDPHGRPVCTSDGTTDDAVWPHKSWVDLAINHTCTSSTERHPLDAWYLALARNTRGHGKPSFCNESGREIRHKNDDGVHRRKQGWLWATSGGYWTWHSWDGCEGINDLDYRAPGEEFLKPLSVFYNALPFWTLSPNHTACTAVGERLIQTSLAHPQRDLVLTYVCVEKTGAKVSGATADLRLRRGQYQVQFVAPATGETTGSQTVTTNNVATPLSIELPAFIDDLVVRIDKIQAGRSTPLPGTG